MPKNLRLKVIRYPEPQMKGLTCLFDEDVAHLDDKICTKRARCRASTESSMKKGFKASKLQLCFTGIPSESFRPTDASKNDIRDGATQDSLSSWLKTELSWALI